jgi:hypothetical protein
MSDGMTGACFTRPNVARVHDALLGGLDNFAPDRELARQLTAICPQLPALVREDRGFLIRAVTWAAGQGIRQFADIGTGMPRRPGVGDAARNVIPSARVAYIDNDAVAVSHVRVLLATGGEDATVDADLADPAAVTGHPAFRGIIDLAEPVCLVFGLVLSLFPAGKAREIITGYADRAAPGSLFAVSCFRVDDAAMWGSSARRSPPQPFSTTPARRSPGSLTASSSSTRAWCWPGPGAAGCPTRT